MPGYVQVGVHAVFITSGIVNERVLDLYTCYYSFVVCTGDFLDNVPFGTKVHI